MSERTSYEPGTPCWIDLGTPDQDAAAEFYGALFGWRVVADENAEQTGGYRVATLREKAIGGVMKLMEEGQPPSWSTYVAVEDADATVAKVKEAGGAVVFEPMTVLDYGRMAFIADPTGAVIGIWQPGQNKGAGLVNEPGAFSWSELNTRDVNAAQAFYGDVFGWEFEGEAAPSGGTYTTILLNGNPVGGILDMNERGVPEGIPAHWQVYFAVEDTDATVEQAKVAGGGVMVEPFDVAVGRIAILQDPHGASFAVIALNEEVRAKAP
jgi:uncharacterized protein